MNRAEIKELEEYFEFITQPSERGEKLSRRFQAMLNKYFQDIFSLRFSDLTNQDMADFKAQRAITFIKDLQFTERLEEELFFLVYQFSSNVPDSMVRNMKSLLKKDMVFLILKRIFCNALITPKDSFESACQLSNEFLCNDPTETKLYHTFCRHFECNEAMRDNMKHCLDRSFIPAAILPFCIYVAYLDGNNESDTVSISSYIIGDHLRMKKLDGDTLKNVIRFLRFLLDHLSIVDYDMNLYMLNHFLHIGDLIFFECELETQAKNHISHLSGKFPESGIEAMTNALEVEGNYKQLRRIQAYNDGLLSFTVLEPMLCKRYIYRTLLNVEIKHTVYTLEWVHAINYLLTCTANELYSSIASQEHEYNRYFQKLYQVALKMEVPEVVQTSFNSKDLLLPLSAAGLNDKYGYLYTGIKERVKEYRTTYTTQPTG